MNDPNREIAEKVYQQLHPRKILFSRERQPRLGDLWPDEQEKFIKQVEAALKVMNEQ